MQPTRAWVRVTGTDQCEPNVPPWRRHSYRPPVQEPPVADPEPGSDLQPQPSSGSGAQPGPQRWRWEDDPELGDPGDPDSLAHELVVQDMLETLTADLEAEAVEAARARRAATPRGDLLKDAVARVGQGMGEVAQVLGEVPRVASPDLGGALASLGAVAGQVESATFALAWEACARGLHAEAGYSLLDWVAARVPWADRTFLGRVRTVATACCEHRQNQPVGEAVVAGELPVRRAAVILEALGKVRAVIDADQYDAYVRILLQAATNPELSDRELARVARHLLDLVLEEQERDKAERAAYEQRSVRIQKRRDGITRLIIDAPAAQAAMITGALTSRLAAPQKGPDGERDPRSTSQRQFDAFSTVFGRGLACPEGVPQMARATVFVTMDYEHLSRATPGHGVTLDGDMLSPVQVRQLACEGEVIPAVLGSAGELLDLGQAVRLATRAQVKALYLRDRGCTFPGCTVPAQWTIAHHQRWWSRGGPTDLDNLALLCERHHTHVHQHDLAATIDTTGVTWHLR